MREYLTHAKNCRIKSASQSAASARNVCLLADAFASETFLAGNSGNRGWYLDSICTSHMCHDITLFKTIDRNGEHGALNLASNARTHVERVDTVSTMIQTNGA